MGIPLKLARPEPPDPTRLQNAVYWAKLQANRARRAVRNRLDPIPQHAKGHEIDFPVLLAESRTLLWSETDPREKRLQLGKVQNLRLAAQRIDRCVVPDRQQFSFWSQVGMPSTGKGFVPGRQIQEGCVVPAIAGGVCQLSNALYDVVLRSGFEVTERHAHTRGLPSAAWSAGRDATVAWNHVDFRFRVPVKTMVRVILTSDELVVQLRTKAPIATREAVVAECAQEACESCETCGMSQCWRHKTFNHANTSTSTAWLVDQVTPEFAKFLTEQGCDALFLPMKGQPRYAWPLDAAKHVDHARSVAIRRSLAVRRLGEQGAARQLAMSRFDFHLADHYASRLRFDATHLVVAQTLLPYLWDMGALGGRTFDVLMTRQPMDVIHAILDEQHNKHPERKLLADYRAHEKIVRAEREALEAAARIVTPHAAIAGPFGEKALLLDWQMPRQKGVQRGAHVVFPGPTVARKGAYELREAMRVIDAPLRYSGSMLEGPDFWDGIRATPTIDDWLEGACVVVQPAILEDQPRKLLRAIAEGVPVVATAACGIAQLPGVTTVPTDDPAALSQAILSLTSCQD